VKPSLGEQNPHEEHEERFTRPGRWLVCDDDQRGSLEVGKPADLAVPDDALMDVPVERIGQIRSMLALMDGRVIHASGLFASVPRN